MRQHEERLRHALKPSVLLKFGTRSCVSFFLKLSPVFLSLQNMSNIAKFKVDLLKANNLVPGALFPGFSWKANEYVVPQSREILQTFVC